MVKLRNNTGTNKRIPACERPAMLSLVYSISLLSTIMPSSCEKCLTCWTNIRSFSPWSSGILTRNRWLIRVPTVESGEHSALLVTQADFACQLPENWLFICLIRPATEPSPDYAPGTRPANQSCKAPSEESVPRPWSRSISS